MQITIGADPELFVQGPTGRLISPHMFIPGTKTHPFPVKGGAVQLDGFAAEFNINPSTSFADFSNNINLVLGQLKAMLPADHTLKATPLARFGEDYIANQPEHVKMLGCDPDFNAYTGEQNPTPNGEMGYRTASGHVHIGWTQGQDVTNEAHLQDCMFLTQALDATLGLYSIIHEPNQEGKLRRDLYGRAGAFRPKPYGVEYRVMSNFWVDSPIHRQNIWKMTRMVTMKMKKRAVRLDRSYQGTIVSVINGGYQQNAKDCLSKVNRWLKETP